MGIFVRIAGRSIEPLTQSFARIFFAFILISVFNAIRAKSKGGLVGVQKKDWLLFLINGLVGFSVMAAFFTLAVLHTSITNAYFLLYTAPVFVVIIGYLFLKESVNRQLIFSIALSFVGLTFLFNPENLDQNLLGNLCGLITGISFACYFVITRHLGKKYSALTITFWTQLFGSAGLFPLIFLFDHEVNFLHTPAEWAPVLGAGTMVFTGYVLLNYGLKKIKASVGSILSLFEPLSSMVYGLVFFRETPAPESLAGAALIIGAIIYLTSTQKT